MQLPYSRKSVEPKGYLSNVITITSHTGVGSSTTLKALKEYYKTDERIVFVSGGSIMRSFAADLGMTIEELARTNREHPELGYDKQCDDRLVVAGQRNYSIIESRLCHALVPQGFHVLLKCPLDVRAKRRFNDEVKNNPQVTLSQVAKQIDDRDQDDNHRFAILYPGCIWPESDFDLVIDTSVSSVTEIIDTIISTHKTWCQKKIM
jgi:cytidylate kinase